MGHPWHSGCARGGFSFKVMGASTPFVLAHLILTAPGGGNTVLTSSAQMETEAQSG